LSWFPGHFSFVVVSRSYRRVVRSSAFFCKRAYIGVKFIRKRLEYNCTMGNRYRPQRHGAPSASAALLAAARAARADALATLRTANAEVQRTIQAWDEAAEVEMAAAQVWGAAARAANAAAARATAAAAEEFEAIDQWRRSRSRSQRRL
jgi:hypothetical protein